MALAGPAPAGTVIRRSTVRQLRLSVVVAVVPTTWQGALGGLAVAVTGASTFLVERELSGRGTTEEPAAVVLLDNAMAVAVVVAVLSGKMEPSTLTLPVTAALVFRLISRALPLFMLVVVVGGTLGLVVVRAREVQVAVETARVTPWQAQAKTV